MEGDDLPVAGDDFTPDVEPVFAESQTTEYEGGYRGTAAFAKHEFGYRVQSSEGPQVVLKQLEEGIGSGVVSFSESVTSINYIGFGVQNAETLFTEPEIR